MAAAAVRQEPSKVYLYGAFLDGQQQNPIAQVETDSEEFLARWVEQYKTLGFRVEEMQTRL